MTCGIYMIKNKKTGQMYIGQSVNIESRINKHFNYHGSYYIGQAIEKYGRENFETIIVEELPCENDLLNQRERYWIKYYNTYVNDNHYNLTPGGDFNPMHIPSIIEKVKINLPDTHGKNNPMYGKHHSLEAKERMSKKKKGIKLSNKHKENMSKAKNTSGYYNVCKHKGKTYKQGFTWDYQYYDENGKRRRISCVDINKLEQKVKDRGLKWKKL